MRYTCGVLYVMCIQRMHACSITKINTIITDWIVWLLPLVNSMSCFTWTPNHTIFTLILYRDRSLFSPWLHFTIFSDFNTVLDWDRRGIRCEWEYWRAGNRYTCTEDESCIRVIIAFPNLATYIYMYRYMYRYITLNTSPGPFPAFQCCTTLKGREWAWGQGYMYTAVSYNCRHWLGTFTFGLASTPVRMSMAQQHTRRWSWTTMYECSEGIERCLYLTAFLHLAEWCCSTA